MTVQELINQLSQLPSNLEVFTMNHEFEVYIDNPHARIFAAVDLSGCFGGTMPYNASDPEHQDLPIKEVVVID